MGGMKFLIAIACLALPHSIDSAISKYLSENPKDDVEFVNPYESQANAAATEADDMNTVVDKARSELVITTLQDPPFSGTEMRNGTLVGVGHAFYIFDLLCKKYNFTYKIVLPRQNILGNNETGIVGQLVKKEVDVAVAFLPIMPEVQKVIDYSVPLSEVDWTILMKRPAESATGSGLLAPFDTNVWILIHISVIAVGPIIYTLIFLRFLLCKNGEPRKYSLATCMWFVYGALLKQGSTLSPVTDSARLLFATWWIFITILTSFYTANLTAFLTLSQFTLPINSERDLANKNQKWIAHRNETIHLIVSQKNNDELDMLRRSYMKGYGEFLELSTKDDKKILDLVLANKMYLNEKSQVTQILFDDYMRKTRQGVLEENRCTFVIMPGTILTKTQAFGFHKNTTIINQFNQVISALFESGIIKYKLTEHLPGTEICPLNLGSKERQLRNSDLTMTYRGIGLGFTVAALAFIGEVICRKLKKGEKPVGNDPQLPVYKVDGNANALQRSPPPLYQNINIQDHSKKQFINGRDYYVVRERDGEQRLVPVRTPSAFLFQYAA